MNILGRIETFSRREHTDSACENSVPGGSFKISESCTSLVAVFLRELEWCAFKNIIIIIIIITVILVPLELNVIFSLRKTKQMCWPLSPLS